MEKSKRSFYVTFKSKIKAKMEGDKVVCPFTVTLKIAADPGCILICFTWLKCGKLTVTSTECCKREKIDR